MVTKELLQTSISRWQAGSLACSHGMFVECLFNVTPGSLQFANAPKQRERAAGFNREGQRREGNAVKTKCQWNGITMQQWVWQVAGSSSALASQNITGVGGRSRQFADAGGPPLPARRRRHAEGH